MNVGIIYSEDKNNLMDSTSKLNCVNNMCVLVSRF